MVIPVTPPAKSGSLGTPGTTAAAGGSWPKGTCVMSESALMYEKRNSFTSAGLRIRVQPITSPCDFIDWSPSAELEVPSMMPPNQPGSTRLRVV
jgi:hypothetical protein